MLDLTKPLVLNDGRKATLLGRTMFDTFEVRIEGLGQDAWRFRCDGRASPITYLLLGDVWIENVREVLPALLTAREVAAARIMAEHEPTAFLMLRDALGKTVCHGQRDSLAEQIMRGKADYSATIQFAVAAIERGIAMVEMKPTPGRQRPERLMITIDGPEGSETKQLAEWLRREIPDSFKSIRCREPIAFGKVDVLDLSAAAA